MSKIRKIISIYLSYRQPRSVRKEFAEWFAAPFDRETKQRLMREYWDALSPDMSQDRVQKAYVRVRERIGFRSVAQPSLQGVRPIFRKVAVVAAMIAIPVLTVALYALVGHKHFAPKWQEIYAPYGQTRSVVLADGGCFSAERLMPTSPKIPSAVSCSRPTTSIFWCTAPRFGSVPM